MPNPTGKVTHKSTFLVREEPDRAALKRQIAEILEGQPEQSALAGHLERSLDAFLHSLQEEDVPSTAQHVCALLSMELDDLRKAALLSLMVRAAGKRKFDPIAAYILQNQKVVVTNPG
jgi:DNA-binding transcriptional regulator LsrR (DeoR family)